MALNKIKAARDHGSETDGLSVVRDKDGHAAGTDANGDVPEVVAEVSEARIRRARSVEDLQSLMRRQYVRWQDSMQVGGAVGKRSGR